MFDGPIEVYLACGFGRSYGHRSSIPFRSVPGILECGLWSAIESEPKLPTFALVTDVGNDLIYGRTPERTIDWVKSCVEKLERHHAQLVVSQLPIHSIRALSVPRYKIFRKFFFPQCNLTLAKLRTFADDTNERLIALANNHDCEVVEVPCEWYGIDPIHYRRRYYATLAHRITSAWSLSNDIQKSLCLPWKKRIQFEWSAPELWWRFGFEQRTKQPAVVLEEGSRVHVY